MKTKEILLYGGGALLAYEFFLKPKTTAPGTTSVNPISTIFNPSPTTSPTGALIGINSGIKGGNGSFYTISNYNQLLAANPNLGNPNYQLTDAERTQYLNNYLDLQQGLPSWVGRKQPDGIIPANIQQAAQEHWHFFGCAEKRIFLPMQPPSTGAYQPPPPNAGSTSSGGSGSSWISVAGSVAVALVGLLGEADKLNDADCQLIFTMSAIIKDILPLYQQSDPLLTRAIDNRMNNLLIEYS